MGIGAGEQHTQSYNKATFSWFLSLLIMGYTYMYLGTWNFPLILLCCNFNIRSLPKNIDSLLTHITCILLLVVLSGIVIRYNLHLVLYFDFNTNQKFSSGYDHYVLCSVADGREIDCLRCHVWCLDDDISVTSAALSCNKRTLFVDLLQNKHEDS